MDRIEKESGLKLRDGYKTVENARFRTLFNFKEFLAFIDRRKFADKRLAEVRVDRLRLFVAFMFLLSIVWDTVGSYTMRLPLSIARLLPPSWISCACFKVTQVCVPIQIRKSDLENQEWKAKYLGAYYNCNKIITADVRHDTESLVLTPIIYRALQPA